MGTRQQFIRGVLLLIILVPQSSVQISSTVPAIILFGDSTVDPGNNNAIPTLLKSNFDPYGRDFYGGKPTGRFCNGRLATDFISEALGLPPTVPAYLDPDYGIREFAAGVSFASAGTGLDNATSDILAVIPLWEEVAYFKEYIQRLKRYMGKAKAQRRLREAIYIVSIGTNDLLANYYTPGIHSRSPQFTIDQYQAFLISIADSFITEIYRLGARKISFSSLSLIGCLPMQRTINAANGGCFEERNNVAREFNLKLYQLAGSLRARLPGIKLVISDLYDYVQDILFNPSKYGFENVDRGCCSTGMFEMGFLCNAMDPFTCPDANTFVFWDASHPSEKMNYLLAMKSLNSALAQFLS
ncbi:GDSL esterase/lipase At4g26790-like [Wolffia australiana]